MTPAGPSLEQDPEARQEQAVGWMVFCCFKERNELHAHTHMCAHARTKKTGTRKVGRHTGFVGSPALAPESAFSLHGENSPLALLTLCKQIHLSHGYILPIHSVQAFSPVYLQLGEETVFWRPFLPSKCKKVLPLPLPLDKT